MTCKQGHELTNRRDALGGANISVAGELIYSCQCGVWSGDSVPEEHGPEIASKALTTENQPERTEVFKGGSSLSLPQISKPQKKISTKNKPAKQKKDEKPKPIVATLFD